MILASQLFTVHASAFGTEVVKPQGFGGDAGNLITFVLKGSLVVGVLLALAFLILGGIEYITSGGEKGKTESARNKITAAIIGLILIAASFAILTLVLRLLNIGSFQNALDSLPTIDNSTPSPIGK